MAGRELPPQAPAFWMPHGAVQLSQDDPSVPKASWAGRSFQPLLLNPFAVASNQNRGWRPTCLLPLFRERLGAEGGGCCVPW